MNLQVICLFEEGSPFYTGLNEMNSATKLTDDSNKIKGGFDFFSYISRPFTMFTRATEDAEKDLFIYL